jgi:hypothetical protein
VTQAPSQAVVDAVLEWEGRLNQLTLEDAGDGTGTVSVSAEHELFDFERPYPLFYSNEDLQAAYAGDLGLNYVAQMAGRQIIWPAASFFRQ